MPLTAIRKLGALLSVAMMMLAAAQSPAVELVVLTEKNWDEYAPQGKEVDCIYGDYVIRTDKLIAVIAKPIQGRNANMTTRNVGGCIIDLTLRDAPNDQLTAFYPGALQYDLRFDRVAVRSGDKRTVHSLPDNATALKGDEIIFRCRAVAVENKPAVTVEYVFRDGASDIVVTSEFDNSHEKPVTFDLSDRVRADRTFESGVDNELNLGWWYDKWFGQAYGIAPEGHTIGLDPSGKKDKAGKVIPPDVRYAVGDKTSITLEPGETHKLVRHMAPAVDLIALKAVSHRRTGTKLAMNERIRIIDAPADPNRPEVPVPGVHIKLLRGKTVYGWGRFDNNGRLKLEVPPGEYDFVASHYAREEVRSSIVVTEEESEMILAIPPAGFVNATITDDQGGPIPCKVQFRFPGAKLEDDFTVNRARLKLKDDEPTPKPVPPGPDFGPDSGEHAVRNLYYSHTGKFRHEMPPGKYDVVISHGPEYDAVFTTIEIERGKETPIAAKLVRSVSTPGWVSADFHSHSTPSGDNTTSQLGRVLNLVCEHIEFAPCTEHNRVDSYAPHIKKLGIENRMATCTGIELTGALLPVNHQNAFPLSHTPRTQNGGGPEVDANPLVQIERLALWDNKSEKLLQMNHPNLVQILGDRDKDGKSDAGFEKMFGYVDVMEVHPPHRIFSPPATLDEAHKDQAPIFHWLQMLNLGYRVPGVVNSDAHYTFHGSGFLRNYIKSATDDPAKIDTMEMVRESRKGHVVVTNGPFLEVQAKSAAAGPKSAGGPGDDVVAPGGKLNLAVRVQCPSWFDIDRVQVFINGRPDPKLNFARRTHGERFKSGVVRFQEEIPIEVGEDAHVVVAAIGENSSLGLVMGPTFGKHKPVAISNPIFVDTTGDGFKPNGDLLGFPLPHQPQPTHRHRH
jgi:hypothetical protein